MQVNPADVRFTQDSIRAYFQSPYDHFSIREAVRRISKNEMSPSNFPRIRVISRDGCLWSLDNRRLWVFRLARCSRISVSLVTTMHPRLQEVLSDSSKYHEMKRADYFPRVRGIRDGNFDLNFQQPSSVEQKRSDPGDDTGSVQESCVTWKVDQRLSMFNDAMQPQLSQEQDDANCTVEKFVLNRPFETSIPTSTQEPRGTMTNLLLKLFGYVKSYFRAQ